MKLGSILQKTLVTALPLICGQLMACSEGTHSAEHVETLTTSESAIIGGRVIDADSGDANFRTLVRLQIAKTYTEYLGKTAQEKVEAESCTGSLIARNIILTAAHCVTPYIAGEVISQDPYTKIFKPSEGKGRVSVRAIFAAAPDKSIKIEKIVFHPKHMKKKTVINNTYIYESKNDVALLVLKENAPASVGLAALYDGSVADKTVVNVRAYGYGLTSALKRSIDKQLRAVDVSGTLNLEKGILVYDQANGKGICGGDSGGPDMVAVNGKSYILGVHSSMTNFKVTSAEQSPSEIKNEDICKKTAQSIYVPSQIEWIEQTARELGARY